MKKLAYALLAILSVLASCKKEIASDQQAGQDESQNLIHIGGNIWTSLGLANVLITSDQHNLTFTANNELYVALTGTNALWQYDPPTSVWSLKKSPFFNFTVDFTDTKCVFTNANILYFLTFSTKGLKGFNLSTGLWTSLGTFPGTAGSSAATTYTATKGYIMGGSLENWEYDFAGNSWAQRTNVPGAFSRYWPVAYAIGDNIYFGTGQTTGVFFNPVTERPYTAPITTSDWYAFNITSNTWTTKASFGAGTREEALGFALGGKVYMGMGSAGVTLSPLSDLWSYDPVANSWAQVAGDPTTGNFPPLAYSFFNATAVNGLGYVVGDDIRFVARYTAPYSLALFTTGAANAINLP